MSVKAETRKKLKAKRNSISNKSKLDFCIAQELFSLDEYKNADKILIFVSLFDEIDTESIINSALSSGKTVAVPCCKNKFGEMEFYLINSLDELKTGTFGVREPDIEINKKLEDFEKSIIIVPGLSFDRDGNRIGYGGGYYDRFLANYSGVSIGLCYGEMMSDSIPTDKYDIPVDIVVTDSEVFTRGGNNGL